MAPDDGPGSADLVSEAVGLLRSFELTEYEARCFVALLRLGVGTAKDVSEVADVPRARVYDSMDGLQERGLVDVQQASPRQFRSAGAAEALDALERRYERRLERLGEVLPRLESAAGPPGDGGDVWVMEGGGEVAERMAGLVGDAEEEVLVAVAVEDLLAEDLLDALAAAADRGVAITAGSPGAAVRERLRESVPPDDVVETWTWWDDYPIRPGGVSAVLMVDGRALLVSADVETSLPDVRRHRAVWTASADAPLVGMMRPLLANAIDPDPDDARA